MKNIIYIGIIILCLVQTSCGDDFLDTTDPTRVGSELFYKNQKQFEQALNGVYGYLQTITNSALQTVPTFSRNLTQIIQHLILIRLTGVVQPGGRHLNSLR
jgi:hypothetical protein